MRLYAVLGVGGVAWAEDGKMVRWRIGYAEWG